MSVKRPNRNPGCPLKVRRSKYIADDIKARAVTGNIGSSSESGEDTLIGTYSDIELLDAAYTTHVHINRDNSVPKYPRGGNISNSTSREWNMKPK